MDGIILEFEAMMCSDRLLVHSLLKIIMPVAVRYEHWPHSAKMEFYVLKEQI